MLSHENTGSACALMGIISPTDQGRLDTGFRDLMMIVWLSLWGMEMALLLLL